MESSITDRLKAVGGSWSVYTAIGSFLLYFLGYLVLRFQLSTWGVTSDLAVLDERYLFAGARFLVYLVATTVSVLLLGSPIFLIWQWLDRSPRFRQWRDGWNYALMGVIFAVLFIQLMERKCFQYMNSLLVQQRLEGDEWLKAVLLDPTSNAEAQFFAALIACVAVTGWLLLQAKSRKSGRRVLEAVLVFLVVTEFLLLPVNYGVVISTRQLPRVANFAPSNAWLVWQGKDTTTFLVADKERKLVALPNAEVKKLEVTGVDNIYRRLFPR